MVRMPGLEPGRPKALPPQDSVSTNSTTSAIVTVAERAPRPGSTYCDAPPPEPAASCAGGCGTDRAGSPLGGAAGTSLAGPG